MALTTNSGTAAASHLANIDFAGKTGTAQVVNHSAGMKSLGTGAERANAWFVGIAPRRNPDIAVVVLVEHGGWGAEASAPLAARVIEAFVDKQRRLDNNLQEAKVPSKVEVGAVWSEKPEGKVTLEKTTTAAVKDPVPALQGGHFTVPVQ
jgi:penicillin-binding protein 2